MKIMGNSKAGAAKGASNNAVKPVSSGKSIYSRNSNENKIVALSKESEQVLKRLIQATDDVFNNPAACHENVSIGATHDNNHSVMADIGSPAKADVIQSNSNGSFKQIKISKSEVDKILGMAATRIAKDSCSNCLVSIERKGAVEADADYFDALISIFKQENKNEKWGRCEYVTKIKNTSTSSTLFVKEVLSDAISRKLLSEGDGVVCFENGSISKSYKGMILLFDVDKTLLNISLSHVPENFNLDVVEAVVKIAREIINEGREGKKVGTTFVIGDRFELEKYGKQMIINPFTGYPEDMRKVTDQNLHETMKNFAMLDGAFMIDMDGTVLSAGTYIDVDTQDVELPGFGTRHRCAAAITKKCNCLAVVVSETGGTIRVFKNGKVEMKI